MDRWACVNVFALPLQLLLIKQPDWKELPVALVQELAPDSPLLELNRLAKNRGIHTGMRFSEALSLVPDLRTGLIETHELELATEQIATCLLAFSPGVEPFPNMPGIFWLNASGLQSLYPTLNDWTRAIKRALDETLNLYANVVVGFTRFATFAIARTYRKTGVFQSPEQEHHAALAVPLHQLAKTWTGEQFNTRDLEQLGIRTVADFLDLPPTNLRRRFGKHAYDFYQLAKNTHTEKPLQPFHAPTPDISSRQFEYAEHNTTRLLFLLKQLIHPLCTRLDARNEKVAELLITFILERLPQRENNQLEERIRPAEPTLDERILLDLVRLRLESITLTAGVTELHVLARGTRTVVEQLGLFVTRTTRRDLQSANRALARVRAEFGEHSVSYLRLREAHLPEAQMQWVPFHELKPARLTTDPHPQIIRRFFLTPAPLAHARSNTLPPGLKLCAGPHIISGGWWVREVHREYYFTQASNDALLWIFYDHKRRRWFTQAELR